jgi:hypothetical protein
MPLNAAGNKKPAFGSIRPLAPLCLVIVAMLPQGARPILAQSKDSIIGAWLLDRSKSDFMPDTNIQSRTMLFEAIDTGFKCTITTLRLGGNGETTTESTFTAHYDGKDVPIDSSALDTVSLRRIDANTIERTGKIKSKSVETATLTVSPDRKVLTIVTKGSVDGEDYSSTQVFNRK